MKDIRIDVQHNLVCYFADFNLPIVEQAVIMCTSYSILVEMYLEFVEMNVKIR